MEYGLTEKGFVAKPLHVILDEERAAYRNTFGEDIDLSNDSVDGAYVGNQAIKLAQLWELLEGLWMSADVDSARGIYLDRLAAFVNVQRQAASGTTVNAALWGEAGTVVHAGHLARLNGGRIFRLTRTVAIDASSLLGFTFRVIEALAGATYSFQISGSIVSHTATGADTEETIQAALIRQLDAAIYESEDNGEDGVTVYSREGIRPFGLALDDPRIEVVSMGAFGVYEAEEPGPLFVPAGALNTIVTNVNGLDSVVNYATGITGRNAESDTELRNNLDGRQRQASGNEISIRNELLKLSGVQFARVYSNRTMQVHNGRPPKSYEAVVMGGDAREIAGAIFENGPAGVQAFGRTETIDVRDDEGNLWEIGFSRPSGLFVWIEVDIRLNREESFPPNGLPLIRESIEEWGAGNLDVGIDLIFQRLKIPVYRVPGIAWADIRVAAASTLEPPGDGDYVTANIEVGETEIALIDRGRITVRMA